MAAQQVFQILDSIRHVHRQLADRYRELSQVATDERIQLLLSDMEHRERKFNKCVAQYEASGNPAVLNTWLQFVPDEAVEIDQLAERIAVPQTLEDLVDATLRLNSTLIEAYLELALEAPTSDVRDLFTDLSRQEKRNDCHYATVLLDA